MNGQKCMVHRLCTQNFKTLNENYEEVRTHDFSLIRLSLKFRIYIFVVMHIQLFNYSK